jgi:hypothetical protein
MIRWHRTHASLSLGHTAGQNCQRSFLPSAEFWLVCWIAPNSVQHYYPAHLIHTSGFRRAWTHHQGKMGWTSTLPFSDTIHQHWSCFTEHYGNYAKPWGTTFVLGMTSILGGSNGDAGLVGYQSTLDPSDEVDYLSFGMPTQKWRTYRRLDQCQQRLSWSSAMRWGGNTSIPTSMMNKVHNKVQDGMKQPHEVMVIVFQLVWSTRSTTRSGIFPAKLAKTFHFYWLWSRLFPQPNLRQQNLWLVVSWLASLLFQSMIWGLQLVLYLMEKGLAG